MAPRVLIVGAGAAGCFTALRLRQHFGEGCEIVLIERSHRVGGNAQATRIGDTTIECGAQFFHRGAQDGFLALLDALALWDACEVVRTAAGFTIWDRAARRRRLHLPATLGGFRAFGLGDWARATKFGIFLAYCYALERWESDWTLDVDAWFGRMHLLDDDFKRDVIAPFLYQFVSLPPARIGEASAKYAVTYLVRTLFPGAAAEIPARPRIGRGRPTFEAYQSLVGIDDVHRRVLAAADVRATLDTPVLAVRHVGPGPGPTLAVDTPSGTFVADHVVLATDPHTSARMLAAGGTAAGDLLDGLRALEYAELPISVQHGAPAYMPEHRRDWQPFNTVVDGDAAMFSVWFGPMRQPSADGSPISVFKSWGSPALLPATAADERVGLSHVVPLPTVAFLRTRDPLLSRWQGDRGLWFAGGWTRWFDSQEAALQSAGAVAAGIAGRPVTAPVASDPRAPLAALLERCSDLAPPTLRGPLAHALDDVEARG
jgi:predicted NAD/FAD-binding protein